MAGDLTIPGFQKALSECPEDLLEKEPELPALNLITPTKSLYPRIPDSLVKDWASHPVHGEEFRGLLEKIVEEFGPVPEEETQPEETQTSSPKKDGEKKDGDGKDKEKAKQNKRKNGNNLPAAKRVKLDNSKVATIESVGRGSQMVEVPMANAKSGGVFLHIKIGNKPYIMNTGTAETCLKSGTIICGFGKGKFRFAGKDGQLEGDINKEIPFELSGPDQLASCLQVTEF